MASLVVIWIEAVPPSLQGSLSRWLVEPTTGVFVGRPSAKVRSLIWEAVVEYATEGRAVMLTSSNNELGVEILMTGDQTRELFDFDGIVLPVIK
jgi:CRISPR-associated protein Cas2